MRSAAAAPARAASPEWEALMAAAQAGDAEAYRRLLHEVRPLLLAVARRRLRNAADSEDAVQDTLLTVHRLRHTYDPARPLRPWLTAICERRCVDHYRRTTRWGAAGRREATPFEQGTPEEAHDAAAMRLDGQRLRQAIARLPAAQRDALQFVKLEEMSVAEAGARAGRQPGAIKVATHRAIRALRLRLSPVAA